MLHKAAYLSYKGVRRLVNLTGLDGPARKLLSPLVGRLFLKLSAAGDRPLTIHGHSMVIASGDGYPPIDMAMGKYEQETTDLILRLIKPGMVVLDIGAHVGYYTLLAARQVGPEGKVYSFEPETDNHALLLRNIEQNGYENIVATKSAVSDSEGDLTLYISGLDNGRHSIYQHDYPQQGGVTVKTVTVDAFLQSQGWPEVGLIKVDVEGAEMQVLAGMAKLLKNASELNMILEFNPPLLTSAGTDPLKLIEELSRMGFKVSGIDERSGLRPLEGTEGEAFTRELVANHTSINLLCSMR